jgi:hypothetical protein
LAFGEKKSGNNVIIIYNDSLITQSIKVVHTAVFMSTVAYV